VSSFDPGSLLERLRDLAPPQRAALLRSAGPPLRELLRALGDEAERLSVVEVSRGLEAAELVLDLARTAGAPELVARAQRARARALAYAGRSGEALVACRDAASLAAAAGDVLEEARCRLAAMPPLAELGRLDEAIEEGQAARAAFAAAAQPEMAARADANLGTVFQRRGEPARALERFDAAREILGADPLTASQLDSNRGEALLSLNDFAGAEAAFGRALESLERRGVRFGAAIVEGNLADLAVRQGRLERALYHFERARRHVESDESAGHLARLIAEQADAMAVLGLRDEALRGYGEALQRLEACGLALEAARARAGLGALLARMGRDEEAQATLSAAAGSFAGLGHEVARARVDVTRAALCAASGRSGDARTLLEGALRTLRAQPLDAAVVRYHRARLALDEGDLAGADSELREALRAPSVLDVAPLAADLLHVRGLLRKRQGRHDEAIADLAGAVATVERVRGSLQAARFRAAFHADRLAAYEDLVLALLERGTGEAIAEAFQALEQARARSLLDAVAGVVDLAEPGEAADAAEARLLLEAARLRGELNGLYSRLAPETPGPEQAALVAGLRRREAELAHLEGRIRSARGVSGLYVPAAGLPEVQALLPGDAVLLEYFIARGTLVALCVTGGGARAWRLQPGAEGLEQAVRRLRFQIGRALRPGGPGARADRLGADARLALEQLGSILLAPLASELAGRRSVVVVPHGALHLVPFGALILDGAHLVESHEVRTAPSASLLAHLDRGTRRGAGGALVVGVADEHAPRIEREAAEVAEALGTDRVLLGAAATTATVTALAPRSAIIHVACHGRFSLEAPLASGLRLADGWLTLRELYPLRLRADLVVLSGCETGMNVVSAGDELVGLLQAFLAAGARSVVASLWRAGDESTTAFMSAFYGTWLGAGGTLESLGKSFCDAQRRLATHGRHPAFWAPFVLVGRP
jgi:tetratricopeptide (TPR) repeat protein